MARIVGDPAFRHQIAVDGQASVLPRFGVERYVQSIVDLYDDLLRKAA
jgi:hypothetical protein